VAKHRGPILLDNNAIGDAVDLGVWNALLGAYRGQLETVREVEREAGTYFRELSEPVTLTASLKQVQVHDVTGEERNELAVRTQGIALDAGERDLWANALARGPGWILCGPDKASMRAAVRLGFSERLVSLEALLQDAGLSTKGLPDKHSKKWLRRVVGELTLEEAMK
jgi:hypothetical protein